MVEQLCKGNGFNTKKIYKDSDTSNLLRNKPQLQKALSENKDISIIVLNLDRLTRDTKETLEIINKCKENNISIYDIHGNNYLEVFDLQSKYKNSIENYMNKNNQKHRKCKEECKDTSMQL